MTGYAEDLAYIHDAGFGALGEAGATRVLEILAASGIASGTVVELGCGSGIAAARLVEAAYDVLGIDQSPALLELARRRAPRAQFRAESYLGARLPSCAAVIAIGEVFNYRFDSRSGPAQLARLFRRVEGALAPGEMLIFDLAGPGHVRGGVSRTWAAGPDWAILIEADEARRGAALTRRMTTFRRAGCGYRRGAEIHRLRLYASSEVLAMLRAAGFSARALRGYGVEPFAPGHRVFVARKHGAG